MTKYILDKPLSTLKYISEVKCKLLKQELGIESIMDILSYFPFRYNDKPSLCKIAEIDDSKESILTKGILKDIKVIGNFSKKRLIATLEDETGSIELVWFKGLSWIRKKLIKETVTYISGVPTRFSSKINIVHPELQLNLQVEQSDPEISIQAIYRTTETMKKRYLNSKGISKILKSIITEMENIKFEIAENIPNNILINENIMSRNKAFKEIHFPKTLIFARKAEERLKFEELFYLQLRILKERLNKKLKKLSGHILKEKNILERFLKDYLTFELTNSQKKVIKEIMKDMSSGNQMNRLLQGDVGSGKTIIALMAMLFAVSNNFQSAMIVPTEVLAEQHFNALRPTLIKLGIKSALLTGSTKIKEKREILLATELGQIKILFGTHSILEEKVKFQNLGLSIVDEQHRFGVAQRAKLWQKNIIPPHILIMTATPIPRTLAMTYYGDLDVSILNEMPQGRKPVKTYWRKDSSRLRIFGFVKDEISKGRQVYFVYPLIEESNNLKYKDLEDGYESLKRAFPDIPIGVLHGKMRSEDREYEMELFREGKTKILVATTVIEVGINVPNATIMIIESAERFGLSQLHQLRGRVGRGTEQSFCILISGDKLTKESKERLTTMIKTCDGFEVADADLKLRGPGNILGIQQSGILPLKIADITKDEQLLNRARSAAYEIISTDPELVESKNIEIKQYLENLKNNNLDMISIS